MPETNPTKEPLLEPTLKRRHADCIQRNMWKVELCVGLLGIVGTAVVVGFAAAHPSQNLLFLSLLPFTVPMFALPFIQRWVGTDDGTSPSSSSAKLVSTVTLADRVFSGISFLFALSASWGVLFSDVHHSRQRALRLNTTADVAEFHPIQWPIDAFHFVSLSFVSVLVRGKNPNSWFELFTSLLGILTSVLMLLTVKSFTRDWYVGQDWVDRVYHGTTTPFPNVTRITHAGDSPREAFYLRFSCAIGCALFEGLACMFRVARFSLTKCGQEDKRTGRPRTELWKDLRVSCLSLRSCGDVSTMFLRLVSWTVVVFLLAQVALTFVPYPRWVVYDSRHVALIAGVAYGTTPVGDHGRWEGAVMIACMIVGLLTSTWATVRTFDLVLYTLASTNARRAPDDPSLDSLFSPAAYEREFKMGAASFLDVYQYAQFDARVVPRLFAATSVYTHAVDWAICFVGALYVGLMASGYLGEFWLKGRRREEDRDV